MKYPAFLPSDGTIGFVAPSFGCATEPYRSAFINAQKKWKESGYRFKFGPNCYVEEGIGISNTPPKCAAELQEAYCDSEIDVIISCGGGELMCEILDYVDFDKLAGAKPKWYMGYSDNTNFTFLLNTLCDTASIYGPCAAAFGMEPWHSSLQDAMDLLRGKKLDFAGYDKWEKESLKDETNPLVPYHVTEPSRIHTFSCGSQESTDGDEAENFFTDRSNPLKEYDLAMGGELTIEGRLLGGCIDCLVNLPGTKYDRVREFTERYKEDGILWFLEACDLNVMGIRRAIWHMEHAGWFRYCKGFLIGRPRIGMEEMMGLDQYHAVCDVVSKYRVPVLMDLDIGHLPPMIPLIGGSMAKVTAGRGKYHVEMRLV